MPICIVPGAFPALPALAPFGLLLYVGMGPGSVVLIVLSAAAMVAAIIRAAFKIMKFKAKGK